MVDVLWPDSTPGLEHDVGSIGSMRRLGGSTRIEPGAKRSGIEPLVKRHDCQTLITPIQHFALTYLTLF